jgi:alkylhydroperoxidase/carboxymuconolactone decarboxylase family protein YurZ
VNGYEETLRRLAVRDDRYIESILRADQDEASLAGMDPGAHALARIGALIALDAGPPAFMSSVEAALKAGVTRDEIVGTLIAVLPVVGVPRVVSAASNLGLALGYDVADALEVV